MKQLLRRFRPPLRTPWPRVFTVDRPRRTDRVIDFFGGGRTCAAPVMPRLKMSPRASISHD